MFTRRDVARALRSGRILCVQSKVSSLRYYRKVLRAGHRTLVILDAELQPLSAVPGIGNGETYSTSSGNVGRLTKQSLSKYRQPLGATSRLAAWQLCF